MNLKTDFVEREVEFFRRACNFTPEEREVFDLRTRGKSVVEISLSLNLSTATVNRRLRAVKNKILRVV